MVTKSKRPEFVQTEIGPLPSDWDVKSLGEIGDPIIGLTYKPANVRPDGLLVLRSSNVDDGRLLYEDNVYVDVEVPARLLARKDDLLICVRNGSRPLIGKCALIDNSAVGLTFGAFMSVFRSGFSRFVFYCFQSEVVKRQINAHLGATINQITNASLRSFRIPLPDPPEQRAIVDALSDADASIHTLDRLVDKRRAMRQAVVEQLITGKVRLPGFTGEWQEVPLRDLIHYERPDRYMVQSEYGDAGPVPVLTANKSFVLGYTIEEDGVYSDTPAIIFDDFTTDSKFVTFPFKVRSSALKILKARRQSTDLRFVFEAMRLLPFSVGEHKRYYISEYENLKVSVPLSDEERAIASVIGDLDEEIASLERRSSKMKAVKTGMTQSLLTGQIRLDWARVSS